MNILNKVLFLLTILVSFSTYSAISYDYSIINQKDGWKIWRNENENVYIQEIDITKRRLDIIIEEKQNVNPYGYKTFDLQKKFSSLVSKNTGVISITNGSFFERDIKKTHNGISYPFYNGVFKENGWSTQISEDSELRIISWGISKAPYIGSIAKVEKYNKFDNYSMYYLTGKNPEYNQGGKKNQEIKRTFIGVKDNRYIYILTGDKLTQSDAKITMQNFGLYESDIVMLDGSNSTQLSFINKNNIVWNEFTSLLNDRNIPQALAVF